MLDKLYDFMTGLPTNAVLRDHRDFILQQLKAAEDRIKELERDLAQRDGRISELEAQIAAQAVADEFVEHEGVLFKRVAGSENRYANTPFCPTCRVQLSIVQGHVYCPRCKWFWSRKPGEIPRLRAEVEKRHA